MNEYEKILHKDKFASPKPQSQGHAVRNVTRIIYTDQKKNFDSFKT